MDWFNKEVASKIRDAFSEGTEEKIKIEHKIFDEIIPEDQAIVANPTEAIPKVDYTPE